MSEDTKATIDILESYWKKGGFYEIPVEVINVVEAELEEKENEIERLNNIIKEALILTEHTRFEEQYASDEILLPILNKLRESGIRNYIKVEGSDK